MRTSEFTDIPIKFKLASLIFLVIAGQILSSIVVLMILWISGAGTEFNFQQWIENGYTGRIRMVLVCGQLFGFLLPGIVYLIMIYKARSIPFIRAEKAPKPGQVLLGFVFLLTSLPLVYLSFQINQQIPLWEIAAEMEDQARAVMIAVLSMDSIWILIINVVLIAVLPAFGEEILFRGILQNELEIWWRRPHLAIWVSGFIFGLIHLQLEGLFPRVILGVSLGYCYFLTRNLWVPIILHFLNNGIQVIGSYFSDQAVSADLGAEIPNIPWYITVVSLPLLFFLGKALLALRSDESS